MNRTAKLRKLPSRLKTNASSAASGASPKTRDAKRRTRKHAAAQRVRSNGTRKCMCYPIDCSVVQWPSIWNEFRVNRQLCDGTVTCSDRVIFHLHRILLSAVSPYFKSLFTNTLQRDNVNLTDIHVDANSDLFRLVLDFVYTGKCAINDDNVQSLFMLADRFEILGILQQCCCFILNQIRPENCIGILRFASHYFCFELEEKVRKYIRYMFKKVCDESSEFLHMTVDELYDIIRHDELNVRNEELVFKAIRSWIESDTENRKHHLLKLISCVRFGLMGHNFFTGRVLTWPYLLNDEKCSEYMNSISNFMATINLRPYTDTEMGHPFARPRVPYDILFAVGGWAAGSPTNFVETYDTRADRWMLSNYTDSVARAYHGLVSVDGLLYVIGGFDGTDHFNTMRCFDPVTHVWSERACMNHARCYVSTAVLDNMIYAMGGFNGNSRMNSVERYDPRTNQWELIAPMQKQRSDASAASLHHKVYIVGGFNGQEVLSSGEIYDPEVNQWTYIHSMLMPRSGVSLVAFRDSLYALGGFNGFARLSTGEKYTPSTLSHSTTTNNDGEQTSTDSQDAQMIPPLLYGAWTEITDMFCPRSNFASVILDEMIFVIGGFNGRSKPR